MIIPNEKIIIRPITMKDADARHRFFFELSMVREGMLHEPDEIEIHSQETIDKIEHFLKNRWGLWLVACINDRIVGEVDITVPRLAKLRHQGKLTIGVHPDFQSQGIGSMLMNEAIKWSYAQGLLRIHLDVFMSNKKAQKLYEKFGFAIEGVRKNFLRHADGSFEDDLLMAKLL